MDNFQKGFASVLVLALVIVLAGGALYYGQRASNQQFQTRGERSGDAPAECESKEALERSLVQAQKSGGITPDSHAYLTRCLEELEQQGINVGDLKSGLSKLVVGGSRPGNLPRSR
ncbi:hypothetical protein HYV30_00780 [Candidatus Kaiserbacteria bacterium]|nr:hypothetical protein [Candidatus Kaiserbacteria bacterium]